MKLLYLKTITVYLKIQSFGSFGVCTKYVASNFTVDWLTKTGCRKVYYFMGIQIFNVMPSDMANYKHPTDSLFKFHLQYMWTNRWIKNFYNLKFFISCTFCMRNNLIFLML